MNKWTLAMITFVTGYYLGQFEVNHKWVWWLSFLAFSATLLIRGRYLDKATRNR